MAKKVVADFKSDTTKNHTKIIRMIKNKKSNYTFIEKIVKKEDVEKNLQYSGCSTDGYMDLFWRQVFAGSNPATLTKMPASHSDRLDLPCKQTTFYSPRRFESCSRLKVI